MKTKIMMAVGVMAAVCAMAAGAAEVKIDFSQEVGPVKPVNGVGQPPMVGGPSWFFMMHYLKEAGIPYSRLHDVGDWLASGVWVDVPNIFPNFDADENDPENYLFDFTDALLKSLDSNGVEPFYRLGITIENFAEYGGYKARRTIPPKDFAKWARICEHIIRHYTEGWANGPKMKVTYWEIWNEPDNEPDDRMENNPLWKAPFSEYIRFYGVVAKHLKEKFPHLKIGGYGSCGFYTGVGAGLPVAAHTSPRGDHFIDSAHAFLRTAQAENFPLDFFSFHSYSAPDEAMRQVGYADALLNRYGFTADKCERIYDEWLPYVSHENLGSALQAAGIAAELIGLQRGPCEVACIYDAKCGVGAYSPLFNPMTYKPHKAYYAFTAFNELRKCGTAVKTETDGTKGLWAVAAKGAEGAAVMLANDTDAAIPVSCDWGGRKVRTVRITDAERTDATMYSEFYELPPHSFAIVLL